MSDKNIDKEKQFNEFVNKGDYSLVLASTLNQMVNYIPLQIFKNAKKIYYITVSGSNKNEKWDKNLENSIDNFNSFDEIKIAQEQALDYENWKSEFENEKKIPKDQKIVWNVTGGQRPFVLAVFEFIKNRKEDKIIYLEGNTNRIYVKAIDGENNSYPYKLEKQLNLKKALQLMGYDIKDFNAECVSDTQKYFDLWNAYKVSEDLRKAFILSNQDAHDFKDVKNKLKKEFHSVIDENENQKYPFGYVLEKMVLALLNKSFQHFVSEVAHSVKLKFGNPEANEEVNNKILDEFDILLLTKTGQLFNFECKSGGMTGDVAKSTNYSTYAVSGVYGKPILITPLLADEIKNLDKLDETYKYIKSAIRAAQRATLEVWGIDEIEDKLNNLLK